MIRHGRDTSTQPSSPSFQQLRASPKLESGAGAAAATRISSIMVPIWLGVIRTDRAVVRQPRDGEPSAVGLGRGGGAARLEGTAVVADGEASGGDRVEAC